MPGNVWTSGQFWGVALSLHHGGWEIELELSDIAASPLTSCAISQAHIFLDFNPLPHVIFIFTFMYMLYLNVGMCTLVQVFRGQNMDSYPPELELTLVVSYQI